MRVRLLLVISVATFAIGCSAAPWGRQDAPSATALEAGSDDYVLSVPGMH